MFETFERTQYDFKCFRDIQCTLFVLYSENISRTQMDFFKF